MQNHLLVFEQISADGWWAISLVFSALPGIVLMASMPGSDTGPAREVAAQSQKNPKFERKNSVPGRIRTHDLAFRRRFLPACQEWAARQIVHKVKYSAIFSAIFSPN